MSDSGHDLRHYEAFWQTRCRRLAVRLFVGCALEFLGPALLAGAAVAACWILLVRFAVLPAPLGSPLALVPLLAAALGAVVGAALRGWPRATDVRIRLEEACGLHNQLSAAAEGAIAFPPANHTVVVTWQWRQILPLPVSALVLVLLAIAVPVDATSPGRPGVTEKPPSLTRLETIVQQLEVARTVDDRALAELDSQVGELAGRNPEDWYTHATLEAAESLRQQTESGLNELASHLHAAATALDQMAGADAGAASSTAASDGLKAALHGLEHGRMPGAGDIAQQLRGATQRQLDPTTARQLADALRQNSDFLSQLAGPGEARRMQFTQLGAGSSPGNPGGEVGDGPGTGDVARGPGTAPLSLAQHPTTAEPGKEGALDGFDPRRAALGDAAGQSVGQHAIDRETADATAAGGSVATPGSGGDAAWTQRLTPAERRAVKRTFE